MVVGFILISCEPNMELAAFKTLQGMKEIEEVELLFGEYDIIVKLNAKSFNHLGRFVVDKIRKVKGVEDTETLPGVDL